jgi:hypothetical protein
MSQGDHEQAGVIELLHWQVHIAWSLADEVHLPGLTDELCLWCPTPSALTVDPDASGQWATGLARAGAGAGTASQRGVAHLAPGLVVDRGVGCRCRPASC